MPRSINDKIPEDLERVLLKALAKDRNDRFASVAELVDAFDNAARGISPWDAQDAVAAIAAASSAADAIVPIEESIGRTGTNRVAATAEGSASDPVEEPLAALEIMPRPRRWPWVGGGLAFTILSLVTFGFAMAGSGVDTGNEQPAEAAMDQVQQDLFEGPPQGEIPSAWQLVNDDPSNPEAHLELAKALASEGDLVPARSEFTKASELYIGLANYSGAAVSLVKGLELTGASPVDDLRVSSILSQALFLGAEEGGMVPAIDTLYEIAPEWTPLEVLDARSLLYQGQTEVAVGMLDRALDAAPEDILANAVMIDILHQSGNNEQALQLTNKLLQRPRAPTWLDAHLQGYQAALNS